MLRIKVALFLLFTSASSAWADEALQRWVVDFKQEAQTQGISNNILNEVFQDFTPLPEVIRLDRKQPEEKLSFTKYFNNMLAPIQIRKGQRLYQENNGILRNIGENFNVQPHYVIALWGMESNYGSNSGNFLVPHALATLAYEGRRAAFFRGELLAALKILQSGVISLQDMRGSWAGAMGQCQFMPSSYLKYAVDYDGDGKKDIWQNKADVLASIANYLASEGWNGQLSWGSKVRFLENTPPKDGLDKIYGLDKIENWKKQNLQLLQPTTKLGDGLLKLTVPGKSDEGTWLTTGNFDVFMKWNRSRYFAVAAGSLGDAIYGQ